MNIIINTGLMPDHYNKGKEYFSKEVFGRITSANPHDQFIFIIDKQYQKDFLQGKNVIKLFDAKLAANAVLWKWWYDVKLPLLLKRHKADVFFDMAGVCSLTAKIPQCVLYDESLFSEKRNFLFIKKNLPRFLNKATKVITLSRATSNHIQDAYKLNAEKMNTIYPAGRKMFHPLSQQEQSDVKNKYTEDQNYFISGPVHSMDSFINLLKAFSVFKKRQKSSWKLVFAEIEIDFSEKLRSYKYRDDVLVVKNTRHDELIKSVGSSYAMVCTGHDEIFTLPPLEAMQCEIPVIVPSGKLMEELYGDSVLYTDPADPNDIADKIMRLYKDETLRKELIKKGNETLTKYSWDNTAELLWQSILKAIQ